MTDIRQETSKRVFELRKRMELLEAAIVAAGEQALDPLRKLWADRRSAYLEDLATMSPDPVAMATIQGKLSELSLLTDGPARLSEELRKCAEEVEVLSKKLRNRRPA